MSFDDDFDDILQQKLKIRAQNSTEKTSTSSTQFASSNDCVDFYAWYHEDPTSKKKNVFVFHKNLKDYQDQKNEDYKNPGEEQLQSPKQSVKSFSFDTETLVCWELFNRNGAELPPEYELKDLKKSWYKVALKAHPDTSSLDKETARELFIELQYAYKILEAFKKQKLAA
jgi:hypothetical protein